MSLRNFLLPILLLPGLSAATLPADQDWKLISERNGIRIYVGESADSPLKTFRGEMIMDLWDEYSMLALYNDVEAFPDWLHMVDTAELVGERSPLDRDLRFTIELPWPVSDREILVNARVRYVLQPDQESVIAELSNAHSAIPPKPGFIRLPKMSGIFSFTRVAPGKVRAVFQVSMDLGGWLPQWLVNRVLRDRPYFTLQKLRHAVHRPEYQGQYFEYMDVLMGPGRPKSMETPLSWVYGTNLPEDETPRSATAKRDD